MDFQYIFIIILVCICMLILKIIYNINLKKIKDFAENNKELDEKVKKYPSNVEICKTILKKLNNEKVKIQEDKNADNCLYIAVTDKIIIANMRESFTRIQTIAHECLHSIQDRRILLFNYIYSNIYFLYFYVVVILGLFKILPYKSVFFSIYILLCYIYYFVRIYLENDAMIKARYVAEDYMNDLKISSKEEIQEIISKYDELNYEGIKTVNFYAFCKTAIKIIVLAIIFLIR